MNQPENIVDAYNRIKFEGVAVSSLFHYHLIKKFKSSIKNDLQILHKTIHSVNADLKGIKFNTAISRLMEFINHFSNHVTIHSEIKLSFIKMIFNHRM